MIKEIQNNQNDLEKEQSWTTYFYKFQNSLQSHSNGTDIKIDVKISGMELRIQKQTYTFMVYLFIFFYIKYFYG